MCPENMRAPRAWEPLVVETVGSLEALRERMRRERAASMLKLGQRLIQLGLINEEQLGDALRLQSAGSRRHLGQVLVALRYVSEAHLRQVVCEQLGIAAIDLAQFPIDTDALRLLPEQSARRHAMIPLCCMDGQLFLAMSDPLDMDALEHARFCAQMAIVPVMALRREIERAIATLYDTGTIAYPQATPPLPPRVEEPVVAFGLAAISQIARGNDMQHAIRDEDILARAA